MNNPIPTTIEEREKLFDEQYSWVLEEEGMHYTESIRGFNHESYNELLRAMVEEIEGLKKSLQGYRPDFCDKCGPSDDGGGCGCALRDWNAALATLQDKLKNIIADSSKT